MRFELPQSFFLIEKDNLIEKVMKIPKTKNKSKKQKLKENRKGINNTSEPHLKTWLCVTLAKLPILSHKRQIH